MGKLARNSHTKRLRRRFTSVACIFSCASCLVLVNTFSSVNQAQGATYSVISTFMGTGTAGYNGSGSPTKVELNYPDAVALDSVGNIYVADTANCVVWKVSGSNALVYAGTPGSCGDTGNGGSATNAKLDYPVGLAISSQGTLYIVESQGCDVRAVSSSGVISTVLGSGVCGTSTTSGPALSINLDDPQTVALNSAGDIYVTDSANCVVWEVIGSNANVFAGTPGVCGNSGVGGPATSARIGKVTGIAMTSTGNAYITDPENCVIWQVSSGDISVVAGLDNGDCGFSGDGGPATQAMLGEVTNVALDGQGDIFLSITDECRIREINTSGIIATVAGSGYCGYSGDGGYAQGAQLWSPHGLAVDSGGNLYIADTSNQRVRLVSNPQAPLPPPQVTSVSPQSGPPSAGNTVDISGQYLSQATKVMFGTLPAQSFTIFSDTSISAIAPAQPEGTNVYITVTSLGGTSSTSSTSSYSYNPTSPTTTFPTDTTSSTTAQTTTTSTTTSTTQASGTSSSTSSSTSQPSSTSSLVTSPSSLPLTTQPSTTQPSTTQPSTTQPSTTQPSPTITNPSAPLSNGYWLVGADGGIFSFGDAQFYGSMGAKPLDAPIVSMATTHDGKGYYEVASDGGIFSFGDAQFYGSMGAKPLVAPIVSMATTPDGKGYYEVASDGGIFSFGDAQFYGSMGAKPLVAPIVSMATTPDGKGYYEVASDGGIFSFGDAQFYGSMGAKPISAPIVAVIG